jgi:hypothetical protein
VLPVHASFSAEIIPDQEEPLHRAETGRDHVGLAEANSFVREQFTAVARRYSIEDRVGGESVPDVTRLMNPRHAY